MTDPEFADRTYIEPITEEVVADIIKKKKLMRFCQQWAGKLR